MRLSPPWKMKRTLSLPRNSRICCLSKLQAPHRSKLKTFLDRPPPRPPNCSQGKRKRKSQIWLPVELSRGLEEGGIKGAEPRVISWQAGRWAGAPSFSFAVGCTCALLYPVCDTHCLPAPSPAKATRKHKRNASDLEEPTLLLLWPVCKSNLSGFQFSLSRERMVKPA